MTELLYLAVLAVVLTILLVLWSAGKCRATDTRQQARAPPLQCERGEIRAQGVIPRETTTHSDGE